MHWLLTHYFNLFLLFVLVLTRIGALIMTLPVIGAQNIPVQIRAFLAVSISLLITPLYTHVQVGDPGNLINLTVMIGREAVLGLALGTAVMILLSGMQLAGQIMSTASGMSLAEVADPTFGTEVPIFSHLLEMLALAIFFIVGGHRQVLDALLSSFQWMPPGSGQLPSDLVMALSGVAAQSFDVGIRASSPVLVSLLLANIVVGLLSRTLPQLNSMGIGTNLNAIIVLAVLAFCLGSAAWVFQDGTAQTIEQVRNTFLAQDS